MNFGDIGRMDWIVENYVATREGRTAVKKYLTSPEGIAMLQKFVGTPEGKETMVSILPHILTWINHPSEAGNTVRMAPDSKR
jgi:hypothetical protein